MTAKTLLLVEDNPQDELLNFARTAQGQPRQPGRTWSVTDNRRSTTCLPRVNSPSRAAAPLPAVVLLDLNLPRIGGLDVLERLRADPRTRLLPMVILTSSDEQRDRLASYENGANSFVRKPLDFAEFAETVGRLGVYWFATNQPPNG